MKKIHEGICYQIICIVSKRSLQFPNLLCHSNFQGTLGARMRRKEKTTSLHSQTQSPGRGSEEENLQLCKCQGFYKEGTHSLLISHPKKIHSRTRIKQTKFRLQAQHLNLFSSAKTEIRLMPNQSEKGICYVCIFIRNTNPLNSAPSP